jgi:nucleoside-diphosphate-sugar epimerase
MKSESYTCLIGFSGFVGGTLCQQHVFSHLYNSSNISAIATAPAFEMTVCAAAPGSMLEANLQPEADHSRIGALMQHLAMVRTRSFVLISSIAVLGNADSGADETSARFDVASAYGQNRRALEEFCSRHFPRCLIIRLPALFGRGLRKNFLFDLLNPVPSYWSRERLDEARRRLPPALFDRLTPFCTADPATKLLKLDRQALDAVAERAEIEAALDHHGLAAVKFHNPLTTYQYYDMTRLWTDIAVATAADLREVHFAPEPMTAAQIHLRLIGKPMPDSAARLHIEDMRTRNAGLWGHAGRYLEGAESVLQRIERFFMAESGRA